MNWAQTKSIFIIIFLLLNSFLGYQLWEKQAKNLEFTQMYESSVEELLQLKNIDIEAELSTDQPEMAQLHAEHVQQAEQLQEVDEWSGQHFRFEDGVFFSEVDEPFEVDDPFETEVFEQGWMREHIVGYDQYVFDRKSERRIVYLQQYEDYPLFIGTLTFYLQGELITDYEQIYYQPKSQGSKQPVISSYTAIRTLLDNQIIPEGSTIHHVTLGYYGQVYEVESQVLTPVWRVVIEHDEYQVLFVNAITGAIESAPEEE